MLWLGSAASQAAEKMCGGDNQRPSWAGHIFQAKGLERRLLCFTRFLRVSCLWHSLSLCNHQFIYPPQTMLPQLYCASWPIAVEKCGHHMLAAIESWAHFFSVQPLSCGNHFKGNHSPYNMLVI